MDNASKSRDNVLSCIVIPSNNFKNYISFILKNNKINFFFLSNILFYKVLLVEIVVVMKVQMERLIYCLTKKEVYYL